MNKELKELKLKLDVITCDLARIQSIMNEIKTELNKLEQLRYQPRHKKEEDEVLSIFSELIDDVDHITIISKECK